MNEKKWLAGKISTKADDDLTVEFTNKAGKQLISRRVSDVNIRALQASVNTKPFVPRTVIIGISSKRRPKLPRSNSRKSRIVKRTDSELREMESSSDESTPDYDAIDFDAEEVNADVTQMKMTKRAEWKVGSRVQVRHKNDKGKKIWVEGTITSVFEGGDDGKSIDLSIEYTPPDGWAVKELACSRFDKRKVRPLKADMSQQEKKYYEMIAQKGAQGKRKSRTKKYDVQESRMIRRRSKTDDSKKDAS